jgi:hypothetical protein
MPNCEKYVKECKKQKKYEKLEYDKKVDKSGEGKSFKFWKV